MRCESRVSETASVRKRVKQPKWCVCACAWMKWNGKRARKRERKEREERGECVQNEIYHNHKTSTSTSTKIHTIWIFSLYSLCRMPATQNAATVGPLSLQTQWTNMYVYVVVRFKIFKTCVIKMKYTIFNSEMKTLSVAQWRKKWDWLYAVPSGGEQERESAKKEGMAVARLECQRASKREQTEPYGNCSFVDWHVANDEIDERMCTTMCSRTAVKWPPSTTVTSK